MTNLQEHPVQAQNPAQSITGKGLFGLGRFHTRLLWVSGIGWMFDAMDIGLPSFVLPALSRDLGLTRPEGGLVASFTFLGMFAGAAVAGNLSDRYGRKNVFEEITGASPAAGQIKAATADGRGAG
jgi:hypothetical protein